MQSVHTFETSRGSFGAKTRCVAPRASESSSVHTACALQNRMISADQCVLAGRVRRTKAHWHRLRMLPESRIGVVTRNTLKSPTQCQEATIIL